MAVKPDVQELVNKAKQSDQKAFRALLNYFWDDVYRFQLKRTRDDYEAEEVTVQTFARAFDKIETYEDSFKFKTWLITI
ncbi:RNA polymerase subunit sigma-70, partial [Aquimarina celericrescens]|nr:RNA polymerase subunit sigma-70 [Aquimarina celericrescens]